MSPFLSNPPFFSLIAAALPTVPSPRISHRRSCKPTASTTSSRRRHQSPVSIDAFTALPIEPCSISHAQSIPLLLASPHRLRRVTLSNDADHAAFNSSLPISTLLCPFYCVASPPLPHRSSRRRPFNLPPPSRRQLSPSLFLGLYNL
ncbi:hypothetical protein M0R45_008925 [Rubus argutus]|uniref:Uncharacterized protein n=1 Tax=Rubus argutus TaxID=59490 RepID=A0AAW1Y2J8_RUBAR